MCARVMVEGESGLLASNAGRGEAALVERRSGRLDWPNGAIAQAFSSEDPESLRGPQFSAAWCDELPSGDMPEATWDMLQFGLRLGDAAAAGGDDDAAADPAAEGAPRRSGDGDDEGATRANAKQSRAGVPGEDRGAL